jgi:hypothetical protein
MPTRKPKFTKGIVLTPDAIALEGIEGELKVDSGDGKLKATLGASSREVVTNSQSQTLTNKTIDVDNNTVSNIETDNLKSGVLNTSSSLSGASNTQVPSAIAAKDYADSVGSTAATNLTNHINATSDAHDASAVSVSAISGLSATDAQAAFAEHQSDIETNATAISDHISDTTDAHDASAISNTPAGTIAATTVQAAIDELDGDVQNHINDTTDAHDASAISVVPTGNLAADDVQEALDELQGDIDTINGSLADFVEGPASATDEAIARFDLTTGKLVQNSVVTITDAGVAAGLTGLTSSGTVESTGTLIASGENREDILSDSSSTGANATLAPTNPIIRLSNASLTSVDMISSPAEGKNVTITNHTGNPITINNDTGGTAANRIMTGTGTALTLADQASILLKYDSVESRWMIVGGSGSGGTGSLDTIFQLTGTDVAMWSTGDNATFLGGGTLAGTFVSNTTAPLHGTADYKYTQAASSVDDYLASPAQAVDPKFRGKEATLFFPYLYDGANNDIEVIFYDVTNAAIIPSSVFIQAASSVTMFKTNIVIPLTCASIRVGFHVRVLDSGAIFRFDDVQLSSDTTVYADIANITEWTSYTPAWTNFTLGNGTQSWEYRIVGSSLELRGNVELGSTSSVGSSPNFTLPPGYTHATSTTSGGPIHLWDASTSANRVLGRWQAAVDTNVITLSQLGSSVTATSPFTWATSDEIIFFTTTIQVNELTANNRNILTAPDTFSTDTANLTYAGSGTYTLSTLANAPVGTFITYTYAINTNTRTQTNSAPTQTTSDMNTNGIQIYARPYNAASTSALPACLAIQIGKGMKGKTVDIFKSAAKVDSGDTQFEIFGTSATVAVGLNQISYNESTGVLVLDAGGHPASTTTVTTRTFSFHDLTGQTNGYLVINASKNPALTGLNINAVSFCASGNAGEVITAGTEDVPFADVEWNIGGGTWSGTQYTVPETGYYIVNAGHQVTAAVSFRPILTVNGSGFRYYSTFDSVTVKFGSVQCFLVKGDLVSVRFASVGATLVDTVSTSYLQITKINVG